MRISIPTNEEVRSVARQSLRENFQLYEESHTLNAMNIGNTSKTWLGYRTTKETPLDIMGSTHFDLNFFWPNACYLTYIEIKKDKRGQGFGSALYKTVEDIAKRLGCQTLTQTPSGQIVRQGVFIETREDYLLRRGYVSVELGQVEKRLD